MEEYIVAEAHENKFKVKINVISINFTDFINQLLFHKAYFLH